MRTLAAIALIAVFCPVAALAQSAPPATTASTPPLTSHHQSARGHDIARDAYIEQAKERAAKRFDRMDADHNGVLTSAERHTYREAHHRARKPPAH